MAFGFKNGTDHTPFLRLADRENNLSGTEHTLTILFIFTLLLLTITPLFIHKTPQLIKHLGVVLADFFDHAGKQKWSRHIQTEKLTDGIACDIPLYFRHREPRHVPEGHHLCSFDSDTVYQAFLSQAIQRGDDCDVGAADVNAVAQFAYRNTVGLLPDGGENLLFKRTEPDFTRR